MQPTNPTADAFRTINANVLEQAATAMRQVTKAMSFTREAADAFDPYPAHKHNTHGTTPARRAANRARNRNARRARATHRRK